MLTISGKNGTHPSNIQLNLQNYAGDDNLMIQNSPVRYNPDGSPPQVIVMAMLTNAFDYCPQLDVAIQNEQYQVNASVRLPIFVNRYIEKVEMPQEAFAKNWKNITVNQPDTFQKIDLVVKNPAPPQIPIEKVLGQLENFLANALNLKCYTTDVGV